MKVFLSYASEDREIAELIAGSIAARGHIVFFDRDSLPAGETYENQIEKAISDAAVFVFLISPFSVQRGRFTLTELNYVRSGGQSARKKMLPVMLHAIPIDDVPATLRTVTILEPEGNVPAEVATAVHKMAWSGLRIFRRIGAAALALFVISAAAWYYQPPSPAFEVEANSPFAYEAGFFGKPEIHNIVYNALNTGDIADNITDATLEFEPKSALTLHRRSSSVDNIVAPGSRHRGHFLVSVKDPGSRYRVCIHATKVRQTCSGWKNWVAEDKFLYGNSFKIASEISSNTTAISRTKTGFIVGTSAPNRVIRLDGTGKIMASINTVGVPRTFSYGSLGLFVGISGPNSITRLDPDTLKIMQTTNIIWSDPRDNSGGPISTQPASMAQDGKRLWFITRGGASTAGLGTVDANLTTIVTPDYYEEIAFDLSDMNLRNGFSAVWSGRTDTTPSSIIRLRMDNMTDFGGHDYEIASCASDVLPVDTNSIVVVDCKGAAKNVRVLDVLELQSSAGFLLGYKSTAQTWETTRLVSPEPGKFIGVLNIWNRSASVPEIVNKTTVTKLNWKQGANLAFSLDGAKIIDLVAGKNALLILLESDNGIRQLISPSY